MLNTHERSGTIDQVTGKTRHGTWILAAALAGVGGHR